MIITEYMENGSLDTFLRANDGKLQVNNRIRRVVNSRVRRMVNSRTGVVVNQ
jgi:hypothetical protein